MVSVRKSIVSSSFHKFVQNNLFKISSFFFWYPIIMFQSIQSLCFLFSSSLGPTWIRGISSPTLRFGKPWRRRISKKWYVTAFRMIQFKPHLFSHMWITPVLVFRWTTSPTLFTRRWRRTGRISPWGNDSCCVWPELCLETARSAATLIHISLSPWLEVLMLNCCSNQESQLSDQSVSLYVITLTPAGINSDHAAAYTWL